jgi:chitodextrinase
MTFALIGGIVTLLISNAQSIIIKNLKVASTTPTSVSLTWDQSPAASTGYKVYRNNSPVATAPSPHYTDTGLTQGTTYKYTISALGNSSETTQSPPVSATPTDNPPAVNVTAPTANAKIKGSAALTAVATDDVTVSSVQFQIDNNPVGPLITDGNFHYTWDSAGLPSGKHQVTAVVKDNGNHTVTSAKIPVTVDNTAPSVTFTSPTASVSGKTVVVQVNADDNDTVAGVQFKLDGANLGVELTAKPYKYVWDASQTGNGPHTLTAIARDAVGNTTIKDMAVTVTGATADTKSPTVKITSPHNNDTLTTTASITSNASDNVGVDRVEYSLTRPAVTPTSPVVAPIPIGQATSPPFHIDFDTLAYPNGKANIVAKAYDKAGNSSTDTISLTINHGTGTGSDTTKPTVSVTTPGNHDTVEGKNVKVQATAADNVGVTEVQFQVDGNNIGLKLTKSPYKTTIDVSGLSAGDHNLTAIAKDAAGNTETSAAVAIKVKVVADKDAPNVSNLVPADKSFVKSGAVAVSADATDAIGVTGVQFKIDSNALGGELTTPSSGHTFKPPAWSSSPGTHNLTVTARDAANNKTTKSSSFTIDDAPPTVSLTAPANNATVSGKTVKISATAHDNGAIAQVEIKLDNGTQCKVMKNPYECTWDTTTLANGIHSLSAIATDGAGNTAHSDISVTVNNSNVPTDKLPPSVPTGLAATVNGTTVTLTWNASIDEQGGSGVAGYVVDRDGHEIAHVSDLTHVDMTMTAKHTYKYSLTAYDNAGNVSKATKQITVKTGDGTGVNGAPVVLFASPETASYVSGVTSLSAIASDSDGIKNVVFKANNQVLATVTDAPYSVDWNTATPAGLGANTTVTATATDTTGKVSTASIKLNVDNSVPTLKITDPKDNSKTKAKAKITAEADDDSALNVVIFVDGSPVGQTKKSGKNYSVEWDTTYFKAGTHVLSATATDPAGNTKSAKEITVTTNKQQCADSEAPDTPVNLKVQANTTKTIHLTWDKVKKDKGCAGIAGYGIYRDGDFLTMVNSNNLVDNNLTIGTGYRYTVATLDRAGNSSAKSTELAASTKQRSGAVKGDVDFDGHVNGRDVSVLFSHFKKHKDKKGDANLDGQVDGADVSVVLTEFGK